MRRLVTGLVAAAATLAIVGTAEAKAPTPGEIAIYGLIPVSDDPGSPGLAFGELFSGKASCEAKRKFKFVVKSGSGSKTADSGKTSNEGGISALVTAKEIDGADDVVFVVAKTEKCAKVKLSLAAVAFAPRRTYAASKPIASDVDILALSGQEDDGTFAGTIDAAKHKCVGGRKVKLFDATGTTLDAGTTTKAGAWALHLTADEFDASAKFKVTVAATSKCSGGKDTFKRPTMRDRPAAAWTAPAQS